MSGIRESCSVCKGEFEVQFRYQMEEREGAFSFFCSQRCLEQSQRAGSGDDGSAVCDACAKRFRPDLVSHVLYASGRRRYACSLPCRKQLIREASGARLGDIAMANAAEATAALGEDAPRQAAPLPNSAPEAPAASAAPPVAAEPSPPSRPAAPRRPAAKPSAAPASRRPATSAKPSTPAAAAPAAAQVAFRPGPSAPATAPKEVAPRFIAVFNHKGGTGKTTTAVSVAAGLASRGKRVLLVDTDAQGNVSVSLGANAERSLYHVLVMGLKVADAVKTVRPGLDLLPSNETLAAAELYLAGRQNRDRVLSERLSPAAAGYDYVVLDCSPSLSLMNQNALVFADSVLVPVACDYLSLVGVRQVIKTVKNVNQLLHHPVQIWGVLPTFFDARANICREAIATLKQHFGNRCLPPIRAAIKVKEAPAQGQTIFEYAAGSSAADDYLTVVERIVSGHAAAPEAAPEARPVPAPSSAIAAGA